MDVMMVVWYAITIGICAIVCRAQDDRLNGPSNNPEDRPMLLGDTVTLTCNIRPGETVGTVQWSDVSVVPSALIFFGTSPSGRPKYTNFELDSDGADQWNLVINNVEAEDDGEYACQDFSTDEADIAERFVEKPATSLTMTVESTEVTTVKVTEGVPSNIVCTSLGSIPIIDIIWTQRKDGMSVDITSAASQTNTTNTDLSSDSVSTLEYTFSRENNGGTLTCRTSGQQLAAPVSDSAELDVQYVPDVDVTYGGDEVICTSEANPPVPATGVTIIVNSTDEYKPTCEGAKCTLKLTVDYDTNVRCNATNTIGTGTATTVAVPGIPTTTISTTTGAPPPTTPTPTVKGTTKKSANPSTLNVGAIVGPLVAVLVGVAVVICAVIYVKKKKNDPSSKPTPTPKPRSSSNSNEMKPVNGSQNAASNNTAEEGKKKNAEGLLYAELDHNKPPTQPNSGQNDIIRTEEATQYADVKSFIKDST